MRVVIMSGIQGSGKSTYVEREFPTALVVSADHFFTDDDTGVYTFDPSKLKEAHGQCLREFSSELRLGYGNPSGLLVVDNTNTTVEEIAPYYALAEAYGHTPEIITLECWHEAGFRRNVHGVPLEIIKQMWTRLKVRELPRRWRARFIA